jgi:hypothetical protein
LTVLVISVLEKYCVISPVPYEFWRRIHCHFCCFSIIGSIFPLIAFKIVSVFNFQNLDYDILWYAFLWIYFKIHSPSWSSRCMSLNKFGEFFIHYFFAFSLSLSLFFKFCDTGFWTQGLTLARQACYHLALHQPWPLFFLSVWVPVLCTVVIKLSQSINLGQSYSSLCLLKILSFVA